MKVLVYFRPKNPKKDRFEGTRLRQAIKGALESVDVSYTSELVDDYQVAHFITPEDENRVDEALDNNIPIIVSAMYCEDDSYASFVEYKEKDGNATFVLKAKAIKLISKATIVLVPSESAKQFMLSCGIKTPIEVVPPAINLSHFVYSKEEEKELFYRYFTEDKNKPLVVSVGDYLGPMNGINALIQCGKKNPNASFYYFGEKNNVHPKLKKLMKSASRNVHFCDLAPIDVYHSALLNAEVFLIPQYTYVGAFPVMEAMAAKCQVIMRTQSVILDFLNEKDVIYQGAFSETLVSLIGETLNGKSQPTIEKAYQIVSCYDYRSLGEKLLEIYNRVLAQNK